MRAANDDIWMRDTGPLTTLATQGLARRAAPRHCQSFAGNRQQPVGVDGAGAIEICFWGHAFVAGPQGEMLTEAGEDEELLVTDIDRTATERLRRIWHFFRDRRVDAYCDLARRYRDYKG